METALGDRFTYGMQIRDFGLELFGQDCVVRALTDPLRRWRSLGGASFVDVGLDSVPPQKAPDHPVQLTVCSLIAKMCTPLKRSTERAIKHLQPLIEERMKMQDKYGRDYPDKPVSILISSPVIDGFPDFIT